MTAKELIARVQELIDHGMPGTVTVTAFDADEETVVPVTGFVYDDKTIDICTDLS